jgi:hypothetical protein
MAAKSHYKQAGKGRVSKAAFFSKGQTKDEGIACRKSAIGIAKKAQRVCCALSSIGRMKITMRKEPR